ncbi:galactokinase [Chitinophaga nivalis]|uniref:Galactokinase n=1 Tax=Chitinophaga nivalis TaxID=2991709 RepID=A0ABT3IRU5_9BACT|nr:galactokinase [Chitinophaga nivalis]MCW3463622.1 galactokinase [Chitinophaga nivalis]MCW3486688.1 galactokinase [Chitinophaga nivalis]
MIQTTKEKFIQQFGKEPLIIVSPGRINLIGEHTDYNDGFVLPAAIDKKIVYAIALNGTRQCNVHAVFTGETVSFDLDRVHPTPGWINYLMGVVFQLQERGLSVTGFDCVIAGDIPVGAGMSSSAAVEGGLVAGLDHLFQYGLGRMDMALIGQKAEHTFPGVKCGIMDQFANLHGKKDQVMRLDCRDLSFEYFPFDFPAYKIVLCNSMVHHSLASSEYNVRRQQCEEGVKAIQTLHPDVRSLRDASFAMLDEVKSQLSPQVYDRCAYVIAEIQRVQDATELLKKGDLQQFGQLMYATHEGLSKLYEVSCPELDFLVSLAQEREEVAGARVMGGGFGGCTINLVKEEKVADYITFIQSRYEAEYGKVPEVYVTTIQDGVSVWQH